MFNVPKIVLAVKLLTPVILLVEFRSKFQTTLLVFESCILPATYRPELGAESVACRIVKPFVM